MKQYDIYGLGTALIDYEFKVDQVDQPLKGGTNLLDTNQEIKLLKQLSDLQPVKACGGSGANTLSVISQLGGKTYYTCKLGKDEAGDFYFENLQSLNIDNNITFENRSTIRTGKCIVLITPDSERTLNSYIGANSDLSEQDLNHSAIENSKYLFIESFLSLIPSAKAAAIAAKKIARAHDCKIAITLTTCTPPFFTREHLHDIIDDGVDLLFCNESEAQFFCETEDISLIKTKLTSIAKQFVITLGKNGALIFDGHNYFAIAAYPTTVVDTTGAGDIFAGAFLYTLIKTKNFHFAGEIASFAAAQAISQYGPRLERDNIRKIKDHL